MARVNIEEKWWSDPRRIRLALELGCELKADGLAAQMWRISQRYRGKPFEWKTYFRKEHVEAYVKAGLGYLEGSPGYPQGSPGYPQGSPGYPQGSLLYVHGGREFHDWLAKCAEWGKKSQKTKSNDSGNIQQGYPRVPPGYPEPLISTSSSISNNKRDLSLSEKGSEPKAKVRKRVDYPEQFDLVWKLYPEAGRVDKAEAFRAWNKLSQSEKELLSLCVSNYADWFVSPRQPNEFRPEPKHFHRFIKKQTYLEWESKNQSPTRVLLSF